MAAASVRDIVPEGGSLRPLASRFLGAANDLHHAILALHREPIELHQPGGGGGNDSGSDLALLSRRLVDAAQPLLEPGLVPAPLLADPLILACRKLGQDLLIRTERVASVCDGSGSVDRARLCELWPLRDVEALGERLSGVCHRWCADDVTLGGEHLPPGLPLAQLSISSETARGREADRDRIASVEEDDRDRERWEDDQGEPKRPVGRKGPPGLAGLAGLAPRPPRAPQHAPAGLLNEFILDSLAYKSMHNREEEVTEAHQDTLEWVFDNSPSGDPSRARFSQQFTSWLSTNSMGPIYWVTGKPGSGKSTFMRFLFQHGSAMKYLRAWADGSPVAKAGFFFWTSGSREQRSQTGLLRYLLHQLLSANPEFIAQAFDTLWQKLRTMTTKDRIKLTLDWTVPELIAAFRALLDAALPHMKICLFIDGLDEFEGDHLTIINLFKSFALGKHGQAIKMCLSSRPWAVFETAFEHAVPNLKLQDLTHDDMYRYARDRLRGNSDVRQIFKRDAALEETVVQETVQRADGVFLWVRLAVNEMLDTFTSASSAADLQTTLQSLPTDLNLLFYKLLFDDQHESEVAETATIYELIRARELVADFLKDESSNSLTVWEIAFALDEADDRMAVEDTVQEATDSSVRNRCATTISTITQRFAGLLDLHGSRVQGNLRVPKFMNEAHATDTARLIAQNRVTYIHRTVRDWLTEAPGVSDRLSAAAPPSFDPNLRLLRSYILRLKQPLEEVEHHRRLDDWYPDVALAMTHARHIARDPRGIQHSLLNELNNTLSWYWLRKPQDPYDHWARNAFGAYELRMKRAPIWQPFLCLATKFGLTEYVREELNVRAKEEVSEEQRELETDESTPLLAYATEFLCSRNKTIFPVSDPRLVAQLLHNPSRRNPGPNHTYSDFTTGKPRTPWISVLRHLRDARRRGWIEYYDLDPEGTARWAKVVRLFLEAGGANVGAVIEKDSWDPEISAIGVMEMLEETYGAVEMKELRELMAQKTGGPSS